MARGLNELVEFLLAEVSLCGEQGASPADVLAFIDDFYADSQHTQHATQPNVRAPGRAPNVDRKFKQKVWTWLAKHPEVFIGKNREGNSLSLDEVEARTANEGVQEGSDRVQSSAPKDNGRSAANEAKKPRIFVSEERMWLAIAGHEPDHSKILPLEFALLSIIASHKEKGIVQSGLTKLSGQDKRSVPKRTDMLCQKGYIDKRAIQFKAVRTSLCVLRKFSRASVPASSSGVNKPATEPISGDMIDFRALLARIFACLKEHNVITRNYFKEKLGMEDRWRSKILSRAVRKLEAIGCVKRVLAVSQYSGLTKSRHPSIMLIREPNEKDLQLFHDDSRSLASFLEQEESVAAELDEDQLEEEGQVDGTPAAIIKEDVDFLERGGRLLPRWTSDRTLTNLVFEIVDQAGRKGLTNLEASAACIGSFYRRPLEQLLSRLVDSWQTSQPLHLRHYSIVRDSALRGTISHYVQYSLPHFAALAEEGLASWEAVEYSSTGKSAGKPPPRDAKPQLDNYGFPLDDKPSNLLNDGNTTLGECLWALKIEDYKVTTSDPRLVKARDGNLRLVWNPQRGQHRDLKDIKHINSEDSITSITPELAATSLKRRHSTDETNKEARPRLTKRQKLELELGNVEGMSEKERLEALGFDQSWTEYSLLLLERPHAGFFITPIGRRRPVGKRQGRPGKSRIAVIKSDKLKDLSWFVCAEEAEEGVPQTRASIDIDSSIQQETQFTAVNDGATTPSRPTPAARQVSPTLRPGESSEVQSTEVITLDTDKQAVSNGNGFRVGAPVHGSRRAGVKRSFAESVEENTAKQPVKKRGRPPKKRPQVEETRQSVHKQGEPEEAEVTIVPGVETPDRRAGAVQPTERKTCVGRKTAHAEPVQAGCGERLRARETVVNSKEQEKQAGDGEAVEPAEPDILAPEPLERNERPHANAEPAEPVQALVPRDHSPVDYSAVAVPGDNVAPAGDKDISQNQNNETVTEPIENIPRQELAATVDSENAQPQPVPEAQSMDGNVRESSAPRNTANVGLELDETKETPSEAIDGLRSPSSTFRSTPGSARRPGRVKRKRVDPRGGSVNILRKKILMDILDQSGGAHPFGTELWYPFTTAWLKTRQTERPDTRTVRAAVKSLIEAGKLRQFTFSGRNSKGLIVTKSIVARTDIDINDALVKDMQNKMLDADPQFYIPPNVEVDPTLKKSANVRPIPVRKVTEAEKEVVVALHHLPSKARFQTHRGERTPRRRSDRYSEGHIDENAETGRKRVHRLKTTRRRAPERSYLNALTIAPPPSAPGLVEGERSQFAAERPLIQKPSLPSFLSRISRRHLPHLSRLHPYAMVMCPSQVFHGPSGTFGSLREIPRPGRVPRQKSPQAQELPQSLDQILSMARRPSTSVPDTADSRSVRVFSEIDAVKSWEKKNQAAFDAENEGLRYINHTIYEPFESAPLDGSIRFQADEPLDERGEVLPASRAVPRSGSRASLTTEQAERTNRGEIPTATRRLAQLQTPNAEKAAPKRPSRASGAKRLRLARSLSDNMIRKVMVAIIVIRTLAGGWEGKMTEWSIFMSLFPNHDPDFIKGRGKAVMSRNRLQMAKMQSDFQERFLDAYEKNQVPQIDYGNLEAYDWEWVVDWAHGQLEMPKLNKLPSLPATREQFDSLFEIRKEPVHGLDEMYQYNAAVTIPRKRTLLAGVPFSVPLEQDDTKRRKFAPGMERLSVAKTWVRANVITPEEVYDSLEARRLLECLGEELVGQAIQSLVTERVISMGNRGRVTPGRNYDVTEHFLNTFSRKRSIESTQLKRAELFKTTILDPQLHLEEKCDIKTTAEDGDILALVNLLAEGRITMVPKDPPKNKYGLTDGGYLTRLMDKGKLRFDIEVRAVPERYVYGNPVKEPVSSTSVPRGSLPTNFPYLSSDSGESNPRPPFCKIPLWFDIHGKFVQLLWDLVTAAVIGSIACRPGLDTAGITAVFYPCITDWEVELVLGWMQDVGVIQRLGSDKGGWIVREWWWLIIQAAEGGSSIRS